jgi:hypothetical protein
MAKRNDTLQLIPDNRTELQKLQEYLQTGGDVKGMKPEWQEKWQRVLLIDGIIRQYPSSKDQLRIMKDHPELQQLSRTQLYRYREATQEIIGLTETSKKKYQRLIADELIQKGLNIAEGMVCLNEMASGSRLFADMIKQYIKLHGLDIPDDEANARPEPNANLLVLVMDGQPRTIDLNRPDTIDAEVRQQVVNAIFQDQTPTTPDFIEDAKFTELPDTGPAAE